MLQQHLNLGGVGVGGSENDAVPVAAVACFRAIFPPPPPNCTMKSNGKVVGWLVCRRIICWCKWL